MEQAAELVVEAGAMDVLVADTPAKMKDAWAARSSFLEGIEEQTKLLDECDVVVPVSKIADFVLYIKEIDKEFDFEAVSYTHLYFYVKSRGEGRFARRFIPQVVQEECSPKEGLSE